MDTNYAITYGDVSDTLIKNIRRIQNYSNLFNN